MNNYAIISIMALFCYLILFLAFMAAEKNKIIKSFLGVLCTFLIWTGGSLLMRIEMWPSARFWFQLSILGLIFLPFVFFNFIYELTGAKCEKMRILWMIVVIINALLNRFMSLYIPFPTIVRLANGKAAFDYVIPWTIVFLFLSATIIVLHMCVLIIQYAKKEPLAKSQLSPIILGILILFAGHLATLVPQLKGFPIDVVSGIINAFCMFYALYKRRLFRLTLLVSRGTIYVMGTALTAFLFINTIGIMETFIQENIPMLDDYRVLIIAVFFTLTTVACSSLLKIFTDKLFVKDEIMQAENLKKFSLSVSKSLKQDEILDAIVEVLETTLEVEALYICMESARENGYKLVGSTKPLNGKNFFMDLDHPLVLYMNRHQECILFQDFKRTVGYKGLWEQEKQELARMQLCCIAPLQDEEELVGILLLGPKKKGKVKIYNYDELQFLDSVCSVASIALNNSKLYEKAYMEARTDELTGLLNRKYFYEVLNEVYQKNKAANLAVIIFNIDDFKLYNQLYGNTEGDAALANVAKIIKASVGNNGYVARYSGKEFAALLPGCDILTAKNLAESIRTQILGMNKRKKDYALKVLTVSCGISAIPYCAVSVKELMENADMAVYHVKRKGKNGVYSFDIGQPDIHEEDNPLVRKETYNSYESTIFALTAAIDTKDHYTFSHSANVAKYASSLAKSMGMNHDFVELIREAGLLHDIGKIGIPEHILNKTDRLTAQEYEIMKTHVENSISIIRNLPSLDYVIPAVIGHHERYDGRGYPRGIAGEDNPLGARILCIADSFDAMISKRTYKDAYTVEFALEEVLEKSGTQFDPKLGPFFVEQVRKGNIEVIRETINES